jgi:predicted nuclease of predicted toxin-antitoxin system
MKFLVDAQLPRRLASFFREAGHEARHTLDLPNENRTPDADVMQAADSSDSFVVTKDSDFVEAFYLKGHPNKLWLISTGNISNRDLEQLIRSHFEEVVSLLEVHHFVELMRTELIVHR